MGSLSDEVFAEYKLHWERALITHYKKTEQNPRESETHMQAKKQFQSFTKGLWTNMQRVPVSGEPLVTV